MRESWPAVSATWIRRVRATSATQDLMVSAIRSRHSLGAFRNWFHRPMADGSPRLEVEIMVGQQATNVGVGRQSAGIPVVVLGLAVNRRKARVIPCFVFPV